MMKKEVCVEQSSQIAVLERKGDLAVGEQGAAWSRMLGELQGAVLSCCCSCSECGSGGSSCGCLHPSLPSSQHQEPVGTIAITPCHIEANSGFVTDSSNLVFGQNTSFLSILLLKMLFIE